MSAPGRRTAGWTVLAALGLALAASAPRAEDVVLPAPALPTSVLAEGYRVEVTPRPDGAWDAEVTLRLAGGSEAESLTLAWPAVPLSAVSVDGRDVPPPSEPAWTFEVPAGAASSVTWRWRVAPDVLDWLPASESGWVGRTRGAMLQPVRRLVIRHRDGSPFAEAPVSARIVTGDDAPVSALLQSPPGRLATGEVAWEGASVAPPDRLVLAWPLLPEALLPRDRGEAEALAEELLDRDVATTEHLRVRELVRQAAEPEAAAADEVLATLTDEGSRRRLAAERAKRREAEDEARRAAARQSEERREAKRREEASRARRTLPERGARPAEPPEEVAATPDAPVDRETAAREAQAQADREAAAREAQAQADREAAAREAAARQETADREAAAREAAARQAQETADREAAAREAAARQAQETADREAAAREAAARQAQEETADREAAAREAAARQAQETADREAAAREAAARQAQETADREAAAREAAEREAAARQQETTEREAAAREAAAREAQSAADREAAARDARAQADREAAAREAAARQAQAEAEREALQQREAAAREQQAAAEREAAARRTEEEREREAAARADEESRRELLRAAAHESEAREERERLARSMAALVPAEVPWIRSPDQARRFLLDTGGDRDRVEEAIAIMRARWGEPFRYERRWRDRFAGEPWYAPRDERALLPATESEIAALEVLSRALN